MRALSNLSMKERKLMRRKVDDDDDDCKDVSDSRVYTNVYNEQVLFWK